MSIQSNVKHFQSLFEPLGCKLIAVSKTHPAESVMEAYRAGQRLFGENKVQEMVAKYELLPKDIEWHLIGHLQRNKVKYVAPWVALIHAVDSLALLQEIDKQGQRCNRIIPCLLQVHIATEETKFGLSPAEASALAADPAVAHLKFVAVRGLMGMATFTSDENLIRSEFRGLRQLFDALKTSVLPANIRMEVLSMGMSADAAIAAAEGSTMVRIGTAIFGERPKKQPA
ncbi:MAG: YggS family pyridoxal phosphate-dependent enzyme [Cyclobacteriaceae bacterium]|nr:YggS family pyridoxal phosphate-dependent enzyme [Cyclobacteriaceae bacterium]